MPAAADPHTSSLRTRPSLLLRVRDWDDAASWNEFYRLYRKFVHSAARRAGLAHADADEVTQDVFKRVAQTIQDFESDPQRGTFRGWLMNLTRWRIADKRAERARLDGPALPPTSPADTLAATGTTAIDRLPAADPADGATWETEWQQLVLDAACDRLSRRVNPRHFQVFDLYVRRGWPVLEVSRTLGLNPAAIYLVGSRLTRQLKTEVAQLQEQLG